MAQKNFKKIVIAGFLALVVGATALVATKTNAVFKGPDPVTNGRLVWARKDANGWSIKSANTAGQEGKILYADPAATIMGDPVWSPDHTKIAFVIAKSNQTHIYTIDGDTENQTTPTALTEGSGESGGTDPSWSPDGSKLLYAKKVGNASNIFIMDANGDNQTQLTDYTTAGAQAFDPSWSPVAGSKKFVFTVADTQVTPSMTSDIHLGTLNTAEDDLASSNGDIELEGASWKSSDGSDKVRGEYDPQFSPDGTKVIFVRKTTNGSFTIGTVLADSSSTQFSTVIPNTMTGGAVFDPAYSPNARHISFEQKDNLLAVGSTRIANITDPDAPTNRLYSTSAVEVDWTYAADGEQPPEDLTDVSVTCETEVGKTCTTSIPAYCTNELKVAPLHGSSTVQVSDDGTVQGTEAGTVTYVPTYNPNGSWNEEEENYSYLRDNGSSQATCNVKIIFTKPATIVPNIPKTGIVGGLAGLGLAAAIAGGAIYAKEYKANKAKKVGSEK